MKPRFVLSALCALTLLTVLSAVGLSRRSSPGNRPPPGAQTFEVRGQIRSLDAAHRTLRLAHEPENGLISHDLRTALISPNGQLVHLWKSNVWTPYEVQRLVRESLTGAKDVATR